MMTTKDRETIANPWEKWPNGVIPGDGNRPQMKLRTPEEGKKWLEELAESRNACKLPEGISSLEILHQEREE